MTFIVTHMTFIVIQETFLVTHMTFIVIQETFLDIHEIFMVIRGTFMDLNQEPWEKERKVRVIHGCSFPHAEILPFKAEFPIKITVLAQATCLFFRENVIC